MMSRVGPAMKSGCIGTPQKVRDQLMRYVDMGIELFLLKFVPTVDMVRTIRDEIIAPLRQTHGQQAAPKAHATAV
jgi:alkanesulfonate monooxygenase SsuD/methylene tetrahydromethanopterin reductase-like flavin-dependent oxidoreductase (luciferase family)